MAKRFTDTDKWKKPFIRGLQGPYKLLWFYILDDCDHAGIWQVDFEVARIRTGEQIDKQSAINAFGDRIEIFSEGSKWFLRDFIEFQYGQLNEKNRMHLSVINILTKNKIGPYKGLTSPQGQGTIQGNGKGYEQGQGTECDIEEILKGLDEIYLDSERTKWPHIDFDFELNTFINKVRGSPSVYSGRDSGGIRLAFQAQLRNAKHKNGNGKQTKREQDINRAYGVAEYFARKDQGKKI